MRCSTAARHIGMGMLALMLVAAPALAQQPAAPSPAALQTARDLVQANGEAHAFDGVIQNLVDGAALGFLQTNPDLAPQLRDLATALRPEFNKRQSEIIDMLATSYATRFTEAELKEALAFYKSPVGQKLVTDRPAIVQQAVQNIQAWAAKLNNEVMDRIRSEMKKKGYDL
ncbi:DUF2059 domain-containing protein [Aquabacter sp. P-9]|uniref:DUF2059 domain-containing protein n=1 Tax=Aquabacter sediminis TaxID=3029197 RepID=UPI00237DEE11|nr:DUF2059 domain-containing protein [Aquabacter sp. P-9]MDE1568872.1 DUF2059 domain-containing protein [Aquabacter sp. P-9]